jgi:hypothetical protein
MVAVCVLTSLPGRASASSEMVSILPCNTSVRIGIISNTRYQLINCTRNTTIFPSSFLTLYANTTALNNVTINVSRGNTIPRVSLTDLNPANISNLSIVVFDVAVEGAADDDVTSWPPVVATLFSISELYRSPFTIANVRIYVERLLWNVSVEASASRSPLRVAPLLFIDDDTKSSTPQITIVGLALHVVNSTIQTQVVVGTGGALTTAALVWLGAQVMSEIDIVVMDSNVALLVNSSLADVGLYIPIDPALINFWGNKSKISISSLLHVRIILRRSSMTLADVFPDGRSDGDAATVVSIANFGILRNVTVSAADNTSIVVRCTTAAPAGSPAILTSLPRSRVVQMSGVARRSVMSSVTVVLRDSRITVYAPRSAVVFCWKEALELHRFMMNVSGSNILIETTTLNFGQKTRIQTLLEVSAIDNATHGAMFVSHSNITLKAESGGCLSVATTMVSLLDNVSHSRIDLKDVDVTVQVRNGTINTNFVSVLMMLTTLISAATQGSLQEGVGIRITVVNTSMAVTHTTAAPPPSTYVGVVMIISTASVVNIVKSLTNSTIELSNAHIQRLFPNNNAPMPKAAITYNITSLVALFDAAGTFAHGATVPSPFSTFLNEYLPSAPANSTQTNLSVSITSNSTATCGFNVKQSAGDCVSLVILPSASRDCRYQIHDSWPSMETLDNGGGGSVVGSVGPITMHETVVKASNIRGLSMLFFAMLSPSFQLFGGQRPCEVSFENVSLIMHPFGPM